MSPINTAPNSLGEVKACIVHTVTCCKEHFCKFFFCQNSKNLNILTQKENEKPF